MKRIIIYAMIGTVTFAAAGGSTMFLLNKADKEKNNQTKLPDDDLDDLIPEPEPLTNQEKFLNNIIDGHLNIENLDLVVFNLEENNNLAVNFKGAFDYKGFELAKGNFGEFRIQGDLGAKYKDIDELINLTFIPGTYVQNSNQNGLTNGKAYFTYGEKSFSFEANTILEVLDAISVFGIPLENIEEPVEAKEEKEPLDPMELLNQIQEKETDDGFEYTLEIPDIGVVLLESTKNNRLSGVKTVGNLYLNGTEISLNATIKSGDDSFITTPTDGESLDGIGTLFNTVANIYKQKQMLSSFNIKFKNEDDLNKIDLNLFGELGFDFSNIDKKFEELTTEDLKNGKYALSILPEQNSSINSNPQTNTIKALYSDSDIYFKVNELLKGKLTNQTISDIITLVSNKAETAQLEGALTSINNFLVGSDIEKLINGDFESLKNIVKDINLSTNKYEFIFNPASFNLKGDELKLTIEFFNKDSVKSISIKGLNYETYFLDFELNSPKSEDLKGFIGNLDTFKDYSGVLDIYNYISKITNSKQISSNYDIELFDGTTLKKYNLTGDLKADLNGVDFNNQATLNLGKYEFNINTLINDYPQSIKANYLNDTLYLNYNDLITNKVLGSTLTDGFAVIDNLLTKTNPDGSISKPSDAFNEIGNILPKIEEQFAPIINAIKVGDLTILDKYLIIDEDNLDTNLLKIRIALNGDSNYLTTILINTSKDSIDSIKIENIEFGNFKINATLNLKDYEEIIVDETSYAPLDNLIYGTTNLLENQKANATINASVVNTLTPEVDPITFNANANIDVKSGDYYGSFDIIAKLPIDKESYHHRFNFDYFKTEDGLDNEFLAKYCSVDNSGIESAPMRVNMHESKMMSLLDKIQNVPEENVVNKLIQRTKEVPQLLPIEEIINGNYELLFNDYLKNFKVSEIIKEDSSTQTLNIVIAKELLGLESDLNLDISVDPTLNKIISIKLNDLIIGQNTANIEVLLDDYKEELTSKRLKITEPKTSFRYFDFDQLDLLFEVGINTTNTASYHLNGYLNIDATLASLSYKVDIKINVLDNGTVNGLLTIDTGTGRSTEIAILENGDAIFHGTNTKNGKITANEIFVITAEEMGNNMMYYLLKYILDVPQIVFFPVYNATKDASSESPVNIKYEAVFKDMVHEPDPTHDDTGKFKSVIDLSKIVDLGSVTLGAIQAHDITVEVGYGVNDSTKRLTSIALRSDNALSIVGILDLKLDFYVENRIISDQNAFLSRYNEIVNYFKTEFDYTGKEADYNKVTVNSVTLFSTKVTHSNKHVINNTDLM